MYRSYSAVRAGFKCIEALDLSQRIISWSKC